MAEGDDSDEEETVRTLVDGFLDVIGAEARRQPLDSGLALCALMETAVAVSRKLGLDDDVLYQTLDQSAGYALRGGFDVDEQDPNDIN